MFSFLKSIFSGETTNSSGTSNSNKFDGKNIDELLELFEFNDEDKQNLKSQMATLSDSQLKLTRAAIAKAADERDQELMVLLKQLNGLQENGGPEEKKKIRSIKLQITNSKQSWRANCQRNIGRRVSIFGDINKNFEKIQQQHNREYAELQTKFFKDRLNRDNFILKPKVKCPHCGNIGAVYMGERTKRFSTVEGSGKFLGVLNQQAQNTSTKTNGMACLNCEVEWDI